MTSYVRRQLKAHYLFGAYALQRIVTFDFLRYTNILNYLLTYMNGTELEF